MIKRLKEILDQEEIYLMSLLDASAKTGSKTISDVARGMKDYHKRISDRIQKEIIDVYGTTDDSIDVESTERNC